MSEALFHEADTILPVVQLIDHAGRRSPLRARGRLRHRDLPRRRVGHEHRERDRLAVGRPARVRGRLLHARDLRDRPLGIHPAHEDLRPLGLALGEIHDPRPVRRPAGTRSLDEEALMRAVRVHDPQRRLPLVFQLVHPAAGVHDLRAVGRDLRLARLLPIEVMRDGEERVRRGLLSGDGDRGEQQRKQQRGTHGGPPRSPGYGSTAAAWRSATARSTRWANTCAPAGAMRAASPFSS